MIRLTGGEWRGRQIKAPPGMKTRPTGSKVREAIFNMLQGEIAGAQVADLFCGAGTMGLEALSRGAEHVTFIESNRKATGLLRDNLEMIGVDHEQWFIANQRAEAWAAKAKGSWDFVYCDPPYRLKLLEKILPVIAQRGLIAPGGCLAAETLSERDLSGLEIPGLSADRTRRHGDTTLWLWRRESS